MDSETEFQLQPSSSGEALELLLGAGLDRVQATNLLAGSSGQRPTSQDRDADLVSRARLSYAGRESGQSPITLSCYTISNRADN